MICDLLDKFIETAKITHRNLSKYGADVNGEVDHLLSLNKYMLRKIEDHKSDTGASFVSRWALAPFRPFYSNTLEAERDILDTFTRAATSIARGIDQLIMKGTEVLGNLDELNSRMIQLGNHFYVEEGALKKKNYEIVRFPLFTPPPPLPHIWLLIPWIARETLDSSRYEPEKNRLL